MPSLVYGDIEGAIYKKFADTAALNTLTSTTSSLFFSLSDKGEDAPYIVVTIVSGIPFNTLGQLTRPREDLRVQFTVIDKSKTSATSDSILGAIEDAYGVNGTALSFADSTYTHLQSLRLTTPTRQHAAGVWQAVVDYRMIFKKAA